MLKGRTRVETSWKRRIFTSNYRCLHTGVHYTTAYDWVRAKCQDLMLAVYLKYSVTLPMVETQKQHNYSYT